MLKISFDLRFFSPLKHKYRDSPIMYTNEIEKIRIKTYITDIYENLSIHQYGKHAVNAINNFESPPAQISK